MKWSNEKKTGVILGVFSIVFLIVIIALIAYDAHPKSNNTRLLGSFSSCTIDIVIVDNGAKRITAQLNAIDTFMYKGLGSRVVIVRKWTTTEEDLNDQANMIAAIKIPVLVLDVDTNMKESDIFVHFHKLMTDAFDEISNTRAFIWLGSNVLPQRRITRYTLIASANKVRLCGGCIESLMHGHTTTNNHPPLMLCGYHDNDDVDTFEEFKARLLMRSDIVLAPFICSTLYVSGSKDFDEWVGEIAKKRSSKIGHNEVFLRFLSLEENTQANNSITTIMRNLWEQ